MQNQRKALQVLLFCFFFLFLAFYIVIQFTDRPFWFPAKKPHNTNIAAIAIRDSVPSYQQAVTKLFIHNYLPQYYDTLYYLEQHFYLDKKEEFLASIWEATRDYEMLDLYILAHGGSPFVLWLDSIPEKISQKIRLVYNSGCGSIKEADAWLKLGAKTYLSHKGSKSISPVFLVYFVRRLKAGFSLKKAVDEANHLTKQRLNLSDKIINLDLSNPDYDSQAYLFGDEDFE